MKKEKILFMKSKNKQRCCLRPASRKKTEPKDCKLLFEDIHTVPTSKMAYPASPMGNREGSFLSRIAYMPAPDRAICIAPPAIQMILFLDHPLLHE